MALYQDRSWKLLAGQICRARFRNYLIIYQTPRLEERMDSHNGANVSCKVTPAGSDGEVFRGIETICIDHEIAVVLVNCRGFASIAAIEELR